ncbi:unnamed protein product [Sphagnum troendelagicum]|uniref:Uncharacterized protein n=1 Tax=Sphagnum troendelagicum TaxID=128251 RepID=A0ABP0U862_9BRYO
MEMQLARREVETWSMVQVAKHMAAILQSPKNGEFNLQLWGLKKQTTTLGTELAARDRCCSLLKGLLGEEDTQSSSFFMDDKNVQLFGHGLPIEVFKNHKLQVKTVLEGSVIHMPASYMSLHATQFFMPADDYHDEFSDKPKFQSSNEEDGGQEPISSSDTLVPDLSDNEQGVVQDGSESLSNHGCQVVPEICFIEVVDLIWGWEKFCFYVFLFAWSW